MKSKSMMAPPGKSIRLEDFDPGYKGHYKSHAHARSKLKKNVKRLATYQDLLYASHTYAVLLIFQAMDAAGKDGTIKHVMSGVNPQGVVVWSFKAPSSEELQHDYLWRTTKCLPARGRIGIFNRSYYEEVLVVRVHKEILANEKLPQPLVTKDIWKERFDDINNFESYVTRNGIAVIKFFLHISKKEQKKRFLERLDTPEKNWKFSADDIKERQFWDAYQDAYEQMIRHTAAKHAPWYVVPADNKWFTRLVVSHAVVNALEGMNLNYPKVSSAAKTALAKARKQLEKE